jgi:hypothetical protein
MSEYRAVELDGKGTRVHRATCKRAPERAVAVTEDDLRVWARPIVPATCCKPQLRQPVTAGWQADPRANEQAENERWKQAGIEARASGTMVGLPEPVLHDDRVKRAAAAKGEARALGLWQRSPKATRGPEPPHPNLDAIDAQADTAERTTTGARAGNGATRPTRRPTSERQAAVRTAKAAARDAHHRVGDVRTPSDDEIKAYMRRERAAHPDESKSFLYEYAYFVDLLNIRYTRQWNAFWPTTQP